MVKHNNGRACAISTLGLEHGNAICYSGYRRNQSPVTGAYPSYEEIREDLGFE